MRLLFGLCLLAAMRSLEGAEETQHVFLGANLHDSSTVSASNRRSTERVSGRSVAVAAHEASLAARLLLEVAGRASEKNIAKHFFDTIDTGPRHGRWEAEEKVNVTPSALVSETSSKQHRVSRIGQLSSAVIQHLEQAYGGNYKLPIIIPIGGADITHLWKFAPEEGLDVYHELPPESLMGLFRKIPLKAGETFYDLGSGTGKLVLTAWLLGMKAIGVELAEGRFAASCAASRKLLAQKDLPAGGAHGPLFVSGSFTEVDMSDADVIFSDSLLFSDKVMEKLATAARRTKPGTRIITFRQFPGAEFDTVGKFTQPASWNRGDSVYGMPQLDHRDTVWTVQVRNSYGPPIGKSTSLAALWSLDSSNARPAGANKWCVDGVVTADEW